MDSSIRSGAYNQMQIVPYPTFEDNQLCNSDVKDLCLLLGKLNEDEFWEDKILHFGFLESCLNHLKENNENELEELKTQLQKFIPKVLDIEVIRPHVREVVNEIEDILYFGLGIVKK